jgi:hypothetical protein
VLVALLIAVGLAGACLGLRWQWRKLWKKRWVVLNGRDIAYMSDRTSVPLARVAIV